MSSELSTGKTVFIIVVVVGCFAVLWPKVFYPMLTSSGKAKGFASQWRDQSNIHHMTRLCFLLEEQQVKFDRWSEQDCVVEVRRACNVQLTERIVEGFRVSKDRTNLTECLAQKYGLSNQLVASAAPPAARVKAYKPLPPTDDSQTQPQPKSPHPHTRQERPTQANSPDGAHPATRDKGRVMPQRTIEQNARPGPMPGIRPTIGGGGHVPAAPKGGSNTMGIIMPLYTVGIVVFFLYTLMKVLFKKTPTDSNGPQLKDFHLDPEYRKFVFAEEYLDSANATHREALKRQERDVSKLQKKAENDAKLEDEQMDQLRRRLEETERAMEKLMSQMGSVTDKLTAAKITEVLSQAQAQAKILKEEVQNINAQESANKDSNLSDEVTTETPKTEDAVIPESDKQGMVLEEESGLQSGNETESLEIKDIKSELQTDTQAKSQEENAEGHVNDTVIDEIAGTKNISEAKAEDKVGECPGEEVEVTEEIVSDVTSENKSSICSDAIGEPDQIDDGEKIILKEEVEEQEDSVDVIADCVDIEERENAAKDVEVKNQADVRSINKIEVVENHVETTSIDKMSADVCEKAQKEEVVDVSIEKEVADIQNKDINSVNENENIESNDNVEENVQNETKDYTEVGEKVVNENVSEEISAIISNRLQNEENNNDINETLIEVCQTSVIEEESSPNAEPKGEIQEQIDCRQHENLECAAEKVDGEQNQVEEVEVIESEVAGDESIGGEVKEETVEIINTAAEVEKESVELIEKVDVKETKEETEIEEAEIEKVDDLKVEELEDEKVETRGSEVKETEVREVEEEEVVEEVEVEEVEVEEVEAGEIEVEEVEVEEVEVEEVEVEEVEEEEVEEEEVEVKEVEVEVAAVEEVEVEEVEVEEVEVEEVEVEVIEVEDDDGEENIAEVEKTELVQVKDEVVLKEVKIEKRDEELKAEVVEKVETVVVDVEQEAVKKGKKVEVKVEKVEVGEEIQTEKAQIESGKHIEAKITNIQIDEEIEEEVEEEEVEVEEEVEYEEIEVEEEVEEEEEVEIEEVEVEEDSEVVEASESEISLVEVIAERESIPENGEVNSTLNTCDDKVASNITINNLNDSFSTSDTSKSIEKVSEQDQSQFPGSTNGVENINQEVEVSMNNVAEITLESEKLTEINNEKKNSDEKQDLSKILEAGLYNPEPQEDFGESKNEGKNSKECAKVDISQAVVKQDEISDESGVQTSPATDSKVSEQAETEVPRESNTATSNLPEGNERLKSTLHGSEALENLGDSSTTVSNATSCGKEAGEVD